MNRVIEVGRLAADPTIKYSTGNNGQFCIANYSLAVDEYSGKEKSVYFFDVVAIGRSGEFAEKYLRKGMKVLVEGKLQSRVYTKKDGTKGKSVEILVERHEFMEPKGNATVSQTALDAPKGGEFTVIPDDLSSDDLPFG